MVIFMAAARWAEDIIVSKSCLFVHLFVIDTFIREVLLRIHKCDIVEDVIEVDELDKGHTSPILILIPILVEDNFQWKITFGER